MSEANPSVLQLAATVNPITVTNINLQVNIEGDDKCIEAKKTLSEQPSTIIVPYVYNWSQAQSGNGTLQTSYTLASDGSKIYKLFRLYSGLARNIAGLPVCFSNWGAGANGFTDTAGVFNRVFLYINGILIKNYNLDPQSLNMLVGDIRNNFPSSSLYNTQIILAYGGIPQQFCSDPPPEQENDLYGNMVAKGLDASKSNLAINIQYQMVANIAAAQLFLYPVVLKSFEYVNGTFQYM